MISQTKEPRILVDGKKFTIKIKQYPNGNTALIGYQLDEYLKEYGSLTADVRMCYDENLAAIDIVNMPEAELILKEYNLGTDTGRRLVNGYVEYPIYQLNLDEIRKYEK